MKKILILLLFLLSFTLSGCNNIKDSSNNNEGEPFLAIKVYNMLRVKVLDFVSEDASFEDQINGDQLIFECEILEMYTDYFSNIYRIKIGDTIKLAYPKKWSKYININDEFIGSFYNHNVNGYYIDINTQEKQEINSIFSLDQRDDELYKQFLYIPIKNDKVYITPLIDDGFTYYSLASYDDTVLLRDKSVTLKFKDGMSLESFKKWTELMVSFFPF